MLEQGQPFPEFALEDQDGKLFGKADLLGYKSIVYFYPKDDTTGCTAEACSFKDSFPRFKGARVIGVSPDSVKSHRKFADKYQLPFTLLADINKELCEACGVWKEKSMYGKKYMGVERTTFILDEQGNVAHVFPKVSVTGHSDAVLKALGS